MNDSKDTHWHEPATSSDIRTRALTRAAANSPTKTGFNGGSEVNIHEEVYNSKHFGFKLMLASMHQLGPRAAILVSAELGVLSKSFTSNSSL